MGRATWATRILGGGALLSAVAAMVSLLFRAGAPMWRVDVVVLGAAALLAAAAWIRVASRCTPSGPPIVADRPPGPPARIPLPWLHRLRPFVVFWCLLPMPAFFVDLASRPDGADLERVHVFRTEGAQVAQGTIVSVERLTGSPDSVWQTHTGDVTVEVRRDSGRERIRVTGAMLGSRRSSGEQVHVLYQPGKPELGGVIDEGTDLRRYVESSSPFAVAGPTDGGWTTLGLTGIALFVSLCLLGDVRPHIATRILRDNARSGPLPAVRARITRARRDDHTTLGERDGTTSTTSLHRLTLVCEDGAELYATAEDTPHHELPTLAAELRDRPGWLCGARDWRLIGGSQPVVFVTDEGEALWLRLDRDTFETVLAPTDVRPVVDRPVRPVPRRTVVVAAAHLPWLGGLVLAYALLLPVLLGAPGWGLSLSLCLFSGAVTAASWVVLSRRGERLARRADGWDLHETRDPALG
ncbi:hypothetical protein [Streptomyces sp. NPDC006368]|uniref:hypothetical protein n=1 Tax=Streptomyces sp. NPDC006368 TaxID=3156760 RepID=UPI0033A53B5F